MKAVLFRSKERFSSFRNKLDEKEVLCVELDFETQEWIDFNYSNIDFVIYYPSFEYSSNHPLSLQRVYDNLAFIHSRYPHLNIYPDPKLINFYNDKYRQYLFLKAHDYPMPETIPLLSEKSLKLASTNLGYPMILKNRYGAGGDSVFLISNEKELLEYYAVSTLNLFNLGALKYFVRILSKRLFYYHLIKEKKAPFPFPSPPLLAQKFVRINRDLKTVVSNCRVVEAHWRRPANETMWKVNIDGGGIGEWSYVPDEAIELSQRLARDLQATWLNIDILDNEGRYLITEFSPVWHHYAFREKPNFVYKSDYNIHVPLDVSLDLERIIVESLIDACGIPLGDDKKETN